jgi:3-phosphoshikimate 1-carboxyvinyltransferase
MQRAVALALLSEGETILHSPSFCDDSFAALDVARSLGAEVIIEPSMVTIVPGYKPLGTELPCRESGLCMRMFTPIAALFDHHFNITVQNSLVSRPFGMVEQSLRELGVRGLPAYVQGPLHGGKIRIDGSVTSQFLTGLLLSLPCCEEDSEVLVENPISKPYLDLTLHMIKQAGGIIYCKDDYQRFIIPGNQKYSCSEYTVEGDWSAASFLLVAGAIAGDVKVNNLDINSLQGDKIILQVLKEVGAEVVINDVIAVKCKKLKAFKFDGTDYPDLIPPLVALASHCEGTTIITGAHRLQYKESNRSQALISEFRKMGIEISLEDDIIKVRGGKVKKIKVSGHGDHRIVMSCAVAGAEEVEGGDAVNKSYPAFFDDLRGIL